MSIIKGFEEVLANKISNIDGQIRIKTIFGKPIDESDRLDSILLDSNLKIEVKPFVRGMLVAHRGKNTEGLLVEGIESFSNPSLLNLKDSFITDDNIIIGSSLSDNLKLYISDILVVAPLNGYTGELIDLKYSKYQVGGIFKSGMEEYDKNLAYVSLNSAQNLFGMEGKVSGYIVNSDEEIKYLVEKISKHVKYPYYVETWKDRHRIIFDWVNTQKIPIIIIFSLIALVGIANIMSTISLMINEKQLQVGLLISQGLQNSQIRKIFLLQSGLIGFAGSLLGSFAAWSFIYIQNNYKVIALPEKVYFMDSLPVTFDYISSITVIVFSFFISIIAGLFPTKSMFNNGVIRLLAQR
tara:strand:- start:351 stop:1409 length:1059 start_codon:yes stop_codon:yes gene_type:complete